MASEVATSAVNYNDVKQKALNSKMIRTIRPASNGTNFTMGGTINLESESNTPMYLDAHSSYIKLKITNGAVANADGDNDLILDGDANSIINRFLIQTAGQTICDVLDYNLLVRTLKSFSVGQNYNNNIGRELMGAASANLPFQGQTIVPGASISVCLPLTAIPIAMTQPMRYIYCGARSPFQFKITLANVAEAFFSTAAVANTAVTITNVEFVGNYVQLSPDAQAQVNAMVGGKYNVLCSEFSTYSTTLAANVTALSFPLGISRSSLDRIIVVHRDSAIIANNKFSLSTRATANIQSSRLSVAGQSYPQRRLEIETSSNGKYVQFLAELLVSNHDLPNQDHLSSLFSETGTNLYELYNGTGANDAAQVGTFVYGIELESMAYNSEKVFSGVNVIGQSVFLENTYSGVNIACIVHVFCQSTILLSLDMNGAGVYSVSV